jgi:hypothetical protein
VSEEHFWRNYFYRVSLIVRQSTTSVPSDDAGSNDEQRCIDDASFEDDTPPTVTEAELDQVLSCCRVKRRRGSIFRCANNWAS